MPTLNLTDSPRRRPTGFTIVELVVTLVVIGILAVVALPRFDLIAGFDETGYRDKVRATLEFARKAAVAQRRWVQVNLAAASVSVRIASDIPEGAAATTFDRDLVLPGGSSNQFAAPAGVTLNPPTTVTFSPLGASSGASVTVAGQTIIVEAETGHVH